ncbi:hypothetical protein [Rhodanobacter sp. C03]|uniref:hypothetical protein n=1 Tax=Rhodanobacter sp. C03 TaxID=1945858 RepID=UPI0011158EF1|nr:hypothetical protein [Rhodanobacter sp. C03]
MDEAAHTFRKSRIDLLKFFASAEKQRNFQSEVCRSDGYAFDEFVCWWVDDFHPESNLFSSAFNAKEVAVLASFNVTFEHALSKIGDRVANVDRLLSLPAWQVVMAAALVAYAALEP